MSQFFLQRYICAHTIAAAESNESLKDFIDSYNKFANTREGRQRISPNFTRLSMTNLPRRVAGRKGNKPPSKKAVARRQPVPYEQRVSLLTSTGLHLPASSTINITSSSGNWNWNWEGITSPYSAAYCYPSSWYPPPYPPSHMQPATGILPFADLTNYYEDVGDQSRCSHTVDGFVANMPSGSSGSTFMEPFVVKKLNGRIKVCAGCKGQHLKGTNNELLAPPYDICLCHREPQVYTNPKTRLECSKVGNVYYHVNLNCIRKKYPQFTAAQVECPPETRSLLANEHYDLLRKAIGFTVQI